MSNAFNVNKFEEFAKIVFNVFPHVNYITLNNSENGRKTNYYLRFHECITDKKQSDDQKCFEFNGSSIVSRNLYLKDINYSPKTNGLYCIERTAKTDDYCLNTENISIKFIPFLEFCGFYYVDFRKRYNQMVFYNNRGNNLFVICKNFSYGDISRRFDINEMYTIAKLIYNKENEK